MHEDIELIKAAQANPEAFANIYHKYIDSIHRFIFYRTGQDANVAEDLTAEVFTRAFKSLPKFTWQGHAYSAYLYKVARSICREHYGQCNIIDIDNIILSDSHENKQSNVDIQLLWQTIKEQYSLDIQEIFELRFLHDLPFEEIAEITGKSSAAVRTTVSRTIKQLREYYAAK